MTPAPSTVPGVRVGVLATGAAAAAHAAAWESAGAGGVVLLADFANRTAEVVGVGREATAHVAAFLERVDLVDARTRSKDAAAVVTAAAAAGRPSLCGWGLVETMEEAQAVADAFADRGVPLLAAGLRWVPALAAAWAAVAEGRIGQPAVLRLSLRSSPPVPGGTGKAPSLIAEQMNPALDFMRWVAGPVTSVQTVATNEGPAFALAVLEHGGGAISHVEASWADSSPQLRTELEIAGSKGLLTFCSDGDELVRWQSRRAGPLAISAHGTLEVAALGSLANWAGGSHDAGSPWQWLDSFRLGLAARQSAAQPGPIRLAASAVRRP
ncbi:MAG: putative NADH-dependent dehydrogenase, putative inositol 2-dehydrogenase [Acidimicrobiaceae bacterium]|nr:putative NADH-dependent dehydrogenase, putative inositol 2-dehydrogenase [Acidimicrobiaceae bacterium]